MLNRFITDAAAMAGYRADRSEGHLNDPNGSQPKFCSKIKKARTHLEALEIALRAHPGDEDTPPNAFETSSRGYGSIWMYLGLRPYMRARRSLIDALFLVHTPSAVLAAYTHSVEMLTLNNADNQGMGNMIPAILLRRGKDQQCYNTLRWVHLGRDPALELTNENGLEHEPMPDFILGHVPIAHLVALMLLKVRLLIDMRGLHARFEATSSFEPQHYTNTITPRIRHLFKHRGGEMSQLLWEQIVAFYVFVHGRNKYLWFALLCPEYDDLRVRPNKGVGVGKREMRIVLQQTYNAWAETPGAFDVLRELEGDGDVREQIERYSV
ncbi:hypothetical protein CC86DRAFT_406526 [Ophiobolus disseminans]|uniref:Uncharacterized protein n=1 Tax=Ophiobolus disseminans TaxID=1469910 RepID=A0A6A6ZZD5_9PLEO|nr:hypothetical protein CC86DRAFT_406526 [Ophiobolus disseminans]